MSYILSYKDTKNLYTQFNDKINIVRQPRYFPKLGSKPTARICRNNMRKYKRFLETIKQNE